MQKTSVEIGAAASSSAGAWCKFRSTVLHKTLLGVLCLATLGVQPGQAGVPSIEIESAILTHQVQLIPASGSAADTCLNAGEQMSQGRANAFSDQWLNGPQIYALCPPWLGDSLLYPSIPLTAFAYPVPASGRSATIVVPVNFYQAEAGSSPWNLCLLQPAPVDYAVDSSVRLAGGRKYYLFDRLPFYTGTPPFVDRFPALNNRLVQEVPGVMQVRLLCPEVGNPLRTISAVRVAATLTTGPQAGQVQAEISSLASGASVLDDVLFVRGGETYDVSILYTSNTDDYLNKFTWGCVRNSITVPPNGPKFPVDCIGLPCLIDTIPACADGSFYYFGHIVGQADLLGGIIENPGTRIVADGGTYGNYRYGLLNPYLTASGGGPFLLTNVMALGGQNYRVYANMSFSISGQTEDFTTPCTTAHVDPCQTTDIGDKLVMNPGYVTGNILLKGFTDTVNCPCLDLLDRPGSRVRASGPCTGAAAVTFAGSTTAGTFSGSYNMALAGLKPASGFPDQSVWDPNVLALHFYDAGLGVNNNVTITDNLFANQTIVAGATINNDHEYCFSSVTFRFINSNPARPFSNPTISGNGSFGTVGTPAIDFLGNPAAYGVVVSGSGPSVAFPAYNEGSVKMCLPQGTYTVTPSMSYPEGGATAPNVTFTVGCNEKLIIDVLDSPSNCCDQCVAPYPLSYTVTVQPGFNFLVNHLCHGTNHLLDEVIPTVPDGTVLYKWNPVTQGFSSPSTYYVGIGWLDSGFSPSTDTLPPGEGFSLYNPGAAFSLTFEGCEPTCPPPCQPTPTNGCSLVGRIGIGTATYTNLYLCPPLCGTRVSIWNTTNQNFSDYNYVGGTWLPPLPLLPVGHSAFVCVTPNTNELAVICATNKTVECGQDWTFNPPTFGSNTCCGNNIVINIAATLTNLGPCVSTYTRIWQITDCFTNSLTCTQTVTAVDTTRPVIHCPTNMFVSGASATGAVVNYTVTATDNCGVPSILCVPPSGSVFPCGTNTVLCTATDACGLSTNCSFQVVVECACLSVSNEQLTCTNGVAGQMSYSFNLFNNTGIPVKRVFIVPEDVCFTATPDIITLNPMLPDGQSRNLDTVFQTSGLCPTNLCFWVVALDSNGVQCCAIRHCVDRTAGPRLVSAVPDCVSNKITVTFSEPLDPATVLAIPNFIVDDMTQLNSLIYSSVTFGPDLKTVCIFTSGPLHAGSNYRLTVNNVRDTCGNLIAPNSQVNFNCPGCVSGPSSMTIKLVSGEIVITWTGDGHLECASTVTGPWLPVPGATSPYTTPISGAKQFYRVVCP